MSITSEMSASSALAPYADGFANELSRRGYAPSSVKEKVRLLAQVGVWLDERGLGLQELPRVVGELVASRREAGHTTHRSTGSLRPMLEFLERQGVIEPVADLPPSTALEVLLDRYASYLASERGLAPGTVRAYVDSVRPFLAGRDLDGELDVTAADVTTFVLERCRHGSRSSAKQTVNTLRSLLRFLHVEGLLSGPLVGAVPTVTSWRLAGLPQGLEPGQVSRLLAACDRRTAAGRRDCAIVLLLVRLGLRAAEVAGLELDDADWRASSSCSSVWMRWTCRRFGWVGSRATRERCFTVVPAWASPSIPWPLATATTDPSLLMHAPS